jgi:hypothetical protein
MDRKMVCDNDGVMKIAGTLGVVRRYKRLWFCGLFVGADMGVLCLTLLARAVISAPIRIMSNPELSILKSSLGTFNQTTITTMTVTVTVTYDGSDTARLEYQSDDEISAEWLPVQDPIQIGSPLIVSLGSILLAHDPILTPGSMSGYLRVVTTSGMSHMLDVRYTLEIPAAPSLITIASMSGLFSDGVVPNLTETCWIIAAGTVSIDFRPNKSASWIKVVNSIAAGPNPIGAVRK